MDTPDKNRISAVSFCNFEDSPVFQYINDLSPIEPVKPARPENILHSFAFTSPSSIFNSPQLNSYRDSRFSIKRHRSLDLSSPVVLIGENVKNSPAALEAVDRSGVCVEQQTCRPEQLANASEIKPFKKQISLAIELADSLKQGRDGCDIQMVSCEEVSMNVEKEIGRGYSEGVLQIEEMEAEIGSGREYIMFDVSGIQNSEQQYPKSTDPKFSYFASQPHQFSLCSHSRDAEEPGGSCSVQVADGAPEITHSSLFKFAATESIGKAEDKEDTSLQPSRKQRSIHRRCLTFDVGGSNKRIPLRESTNDLPLDFTSINNAPTPQKCLDTSKEDTYEIPPIPQTIGLHLNGLVNPSVSSDQNKLKIKGGRVFPHGPTKFHLNIEDEFSTPVSTKRDLVSCDTEIMEAHQILMEGECFDNHMATDNTQLSQGHDELGSCKRCRCRKSKCLKLYCDCFAAGLYCDGPCSCQNCFNKPKYENVVIKTRQLIEARNPLAFAPKVVSTSDSAIEFWDENNKTPASARHKSGCNCKKSGCLKKYCECFMMGVGCSSSCRCMGCKNVYGHANEQCMGESDSVTIMEKALDNGEYVNASSQNEKTL